MVSDNHAMLATSRGHQWLALIGAAFLIFELIFIGFYSNNFWFSCNLSLWGLPAICLALLTAHFVLTFIESDQGCKLLAFIFKGKPPLVYRRWVRLQDEGFCIGLRHVRWQAIDEAGLTWLGNGEIKSRAVCGQGQQQPDVVFRFPFSAAAQNEQKLFLEHLKKHRPDAVITTRLAKRVESPIVRGQNLVQAFGGAMMFALLLDLGFSSFYYLEMLKHYYLADVAAIAGDKATMQAELAQADHAYQHPFPLSYISTRFLSTGNCASGIASTKADVFWNAGRKDEAVVQAERAIELSPQTSRLKFRYARFLEETGQRAKARQVISELIDKHKDWLLPRLYELANIHDTHPERVPESYKWTMQKLSDQLFTNEPAWPPGGESFAHDLFFSDDIYFVFDRLLGTHAQRQH